MRLSQYGNRRDTAPGSRRLSKQTPNQLPLTKPEIVPIAERPHPRDEFRS